MFMVMRMIMGFTMLVSMITVFVALGTVVMLATLSMLVFLVIVVMFMIMMVSILAVLVALGAVVVLASLSMLVIMVSSMSLLI